MQETTIQQMRVKAYWRKYGHFCATALKSTMHSPYENPIMILKNVNIKDGIYFTEVYSKNHGKEVMIYHDGNVTRKQIPLGVAVKPLIINKEFLNNCIRGLGH